MRIITPIGAALFIAAVVAQAAPAHGDAPHSLRLVATFEQGTMTDAPPAGDSLGDEQVASGVLTNSAGRRVGRFGFTCTWVGVTTDDALERCSAWGEIGGDQIVLDGMSVASESHHIWAVTGGTGRFRRARGDARIADRSDTEALVTIRLAR
jgi:hypothetical protein